MKKLIDTAMGREKADLVLKNGNIIDVFNGRVIKCDVAIKNGVIVGLGEYEGNTEIDAEGKYIAPGFIDSHVHIESSLLTPSQYARLVVPKGVTTLIADPHEIVNVCGEKGLEFMLEDAKTVPLDINYMLPSCVPAAPFDMGGASIDGDKTLELLEKHNLIGLGEMMNYPGVMFCDEDVLKKLSCESIIDGHAPMVSGKELCAYTCGGIATDHECGTVEEAIEKISMGMRVIIREGTGAKNLEMLVKAITPFNRDRFMFCTDDKSLDDVKAEGTISHCINKAIKCGIEPITAFAMASINSANCYGIKNIGAIAPGYKADIVVLGSLDAKNIERVFKAGIEVASAGKPLFESESYECGCVLNTVNIPKITAKELELEFVPNSLAIKVTAGSLITTAVYPQNRAGLSLCANIERYRKSGDIGKCFIEGFDIEDGAVAQTIGHDNHNITVAGSDAENMAVAVNALGKEGGIVVVKNREVIARLVLEVGGIMSAGNYEDVLRAHDDVLEAVKKISPDASSTIMMILSFISLLVIPDIKLSSKGLFDVNKFGFVE